MYAVKDYSKFSWHSIEAKNPYSTIQVSLFLWAGDENKNLIW